MNFGIFTGVIFDVVLAFAGCILGLLFKSQLMVRIGDRILHTFALLVIAMGVSSAMHVDNLYLVLASIVIGVPIGEVCDIEGKISSIGDSIERLASNRNLRGDVGKAFAHSTMLFCIGSMTIMGALQSGISNTHTILFTKGVLDFVTGATLTISMGPGAAMGVILLLLYEGGLVLLAKWVSPVMNAEVLNAFDVIGGVLLIGVALSVLNIRDVKVANLIPSMFIPMIYGGVLYFINTI